MLHNFTYMKFLEKANDSDRRQINGYSSSGVGGWFVKKRHQGSFYLIDIF